MHTVSAQYSCVYDNTPTAPVNGQFSSQRKVDLGKKNETITTARKSVSNLVK